MEDLRVKIRENFAKKRLSKQSAWVLCITAIDKFLWDKIQVSWYLKNWIIFLKTQPSFGKNEVYMKKIEIINILNKKLKSFWYRLKIKDIMIKA